jgi:two-component system KDP operon response regulator KdpE
VTIAPVILVVEDDRRLAHVVEMALQSEGYHVIDVSTGQCAITEVRTRNPDLVLLDLGLPDIDGLALLPTIRANSAAPIMIVSGCGDAMQKVRALNSGADDYLTKPFSLPELVARVRAILRSHARLAGGDATTVSFGDYTLDFVARRLLHGKHQVPLSITEFKLLATLARHPGRMVSTDTLLKETWGTAYQRKQGYVRVYMHALRSKLEPEPSRPKYLLNEPGFGYRLNTSEG